MREAVGPARIEAARGGSEADTAAIIARFLPLIRRAAAQASRPGLDFDDAVQEGLIGLFSAIQSYRPGQRASFPTYAAVCVRNAVFSAVRAAGRKKHAVLSHSVPLPDIPAVPGPEEQAIADERLSRTLERVRSLLSPLEKTVLGLYLRGRTHAQIADAIGRGQKSVENALARLRRKLREH